MDEIIAALESIETEGSFCASKTVTPKNLNIKVNKIGQLDYPVSQPQIEALISQAKPASFGFKNQTILDPSVRKVLEIPKSRVSIPIKQWRAKFEPILDEFKEKLGLPKKSTLKAELHNMLIYESGCFFKPHQDSEKKDGMVASLVVVLPSEHTGGELIIEHNGKKETFKSKQTKIPKISFIGFYADCPHEVKEVKSGHRITLTYNLILEGYKGQVYIPNDQDFNVRLKEAMQRYFVDGNSNDPFDNNKTPKLVYLLDHQYTEKSLSWDLLKNHDLERASALLSIADDMGLSAHLVLADMRETWECEYDYDSYRSRRDYYDDDDDEDEDQDEEGEPVYIVDSEVVLKHWLSRSGESIEFKDFCPSNKEICWTNDNELNKPYESEYEGWMGNYGNTLDRWYHRAAIVLWRKEDYYAILFEIDQDQFVNHIFDLVDQNDQEELQKMLQYVVPYWSNYARNHNESDDIKKVLHLAKRLGDASISFKLLKPYDSNIFSLEHLTIWMDLLKLYGCEWGIDLLDVLTKNGSHYRGLTEFNTLDKIFKELKSESKNEPLITWLGKYQLSSIKTNHLQKYFVTSEYRSKAGKRVEDINDLLVALITADNKLLFEETLAYVMDNNSTYDDLYLAQLTLTMKNKLPAVWDISILQIHVKNRLVSEQSQGAPDPENWSITDKPKCKCAECKVLAHYLSDKDAKDKIWPLLQDTRRHVEHELSQMKVPVNYKVDKKGRPYKLVLMKSKEIYDQSKIRYDKVNEALSFL
jgi:hypothetical protein